jgi:transcriptional regulator with XRE-family HTH domain
MKGSDLKAFRKANGLTQTVLGEFLGINKSFISTIESGKDPMPKDKLSKLIHNSRGWDTSMLVTVSPGITQGIAIPKVKVVGDVSRREATSDKAYELLVKDYQRQIADKDATIQELCKKIGMLEAKIELLGKGDITPESV